MDPPSTPQLIWSKIDAVSGVPEARHSHCAAIVTLPDREPYMFVFGGVVGGDRTNSLLRFSTETKTWDPLVSFGQAPSPRCNHACFVYGGSMFVHGGEVLVRSTPGADAERVSLVKGSVTTTVPSQAGFARMCVDDMYRLDCASLTWTLAPAGLAPMPRKGHSIAVISHVDNSIGAGGGMHPTAVLFGGCAAAGTPWDDSVYAMPLDVDGWACMWSKVLKPLSTSIPGVGPVWPTARQGHTFTAVSSSKIVLFGGDAAGTLSNEVFLFDMELALLSNSRGRATGASAVMKSPWSRISGQGRPPLPRHSHTSVFIPEVPGKRPASLLVFGGVTIKQEQLHFPKELFVLDLASCVWSQASIGFTYPSARSGHSMVALPSVDFGCVPPTALDEPPVFLVFGGIHTMYCTNDIWQLRPRRRRSRFYSTMQKHVDAVVGASTTTGRLDTVVKVGALDDAHSGSDDEDWIVADDTAGEAEAEGIVAPVDGAEGETTLTTTVVPFRGGDGTRGSATRLLGDGDALVQELHTELLKVKKALIRSQESHAVEVTRRQRCEDELDDLRAQLAAASAQLAEQQTAFAAEKAVLLEECNTRVTKAEAVAQQATADLTLVTRLLTLQDVITDLRVEGWRAHTERLGAKDFSRGESEVQDALRTLPDDPLSDSDEVDEALAVTKTRL